MMRRTHLKRAITFLASGVVAAALAVVSVRAQASSQGEAGVQTVHALFDLTSPSGNPFPSDRFTTLDTNQNTGRRVNLPLPDCGAFPSDCEDIEVLNTLDGFNM